MLLVLNRKTRGKKGKKQIKEETDMDQLSTKIANKLSQRKQMVY